MSAYPVFSLHKVQTGKANLMLLVVGIEVSFGEVTGWATGRLLECSCGCSLQECVHVLKFIKLYNYDLCTCLYADYTSKKFNTLVYFKRINFKKTKF